MEIVPKSLFSLELQRGFGDATRTFFLGGVILSVIGDSPDDLFKKKQKKTRYTLHFASPHLTSFL